MVGDASFVGVLTNAQRPPPPQPTHPTNRPTDPQSDPVRELCFDLGVEDVTLLSGAEINATSNYLVFLNGLIVGCHSRPRRFVRLLRLLRRKGLVAEFVSVYLHEVQRAVYIATDGGRVCRPLLVCERGRPRLTGMMMRQLSAGLLTWGS